MLIVLGDSTAPKEQSIRTNIPVLSAIMAQQKVLQRPMDALYALQITTAH